MSACLVGLKFNPGSVPEVQKGSSDIFIVMRRREGREFVFQAQYLNEFPLEYEECKCKLEHDDGCPTTGWFYNESNLEYQDCYWPIKYDEIVAWARLPSADEVKAALDEGHTP